MKTLEGKVAIITGAAVGLGKGIATVYAKYGAKMCLVDLYQKSKKRRRNYEKATAQKSSHMLEMSPIKTI